MAIHDRPFAPPADPPSVRSVASSTALHSPGATASALASCPMEVRQGSGLVAPIGDPASAPGQPCGQSPELSRGDNQRSPCRLGERTRGPRARRLAATRRSRRAHEHRALVADAVCIGKRLDVDALPDRASIRSSVEPTLGPAVLPAPRTRCRTDRASRRGGRLARSIGAVPASPACPAWSAGLRARSRRCRRRSRARSRGPAASGW